MKCVKTKAKVSSRGRDVVRGSVKFDHSVVKPEWGSLVKILSY